MSNRNCRVGKQYKIKEKFSFKKAVIGFNPFNPILWAKSLSTLFHYVIIGLICFGLVYGCGYWKGRGQGPVSVGYKDFKTFVVDKDGQKHEIEVKKHILYFDKKTVRVKDIPKLKPYGIHIKPKIFAGVSSAMDGEVGIGVETLYYYKFNLDVFGTQKAIYLGVSRDIELDKLGVNNSSVGIAAGHAYSGKKDDYRFLAYWSWKF